MNRLRFFSVLLGAALGAAAPAADTTYTLGTPKPARLLVAEDSATPRNEWLEENPVFVATAGFTTTDGISERTETTLDRYRLTSAESGFSWERSKPEYWLADRLVAPADTDWNASYAYYLELQSRGDPFVSGFLFNPDPTDPCVYVVRGGTQRFRWVTTDARTNDMSYVVGQTCSGRPRRIFWTDSPYNAPPVSLAGKFVKFYGDPTILTLRYGVETNVMGGVTTVVSNKVVSGLYVDPSSHTLYAAGKLSGMVIMAYYETGNFDNLLSVQTVEVCRPEVIPLKGTIGEALRPSGTGYSGKGLSANVTAGIGDSRDVRGDYLYQHAGKFSYSPKNGDVFPIRPTEGNRWNAEIYWMETDDMGVRWPFELDQYDSDWPDSGYIFVRGDVRDETQNVDYGAKIIIPTEYAATLEKYQEPEGHAVGVNDDNTFGTTGEGWSLLRLTANDNIWFLPIHSILRSNKDYFMLKPSRIDVGQEIMLRSGSRSGVANNRFFMADARIPGYLYKAVSGTQYATNLYHEASPTKSSSDASSGSTNSVPSALYAIATAEKDLEVWWYTVQKEDDMPVEITVPTLPQVFRPVWPAPEAAPQIVLASQEGSANKMRYAHNGAAYFDNTDSVLELPDRRFFPSRAGTVMFWTRPVHYADGLENFSAPPEPSGLLSIGHGPRFSFGEPKLAIAIEDGGRLVVRSNGAVVLETPIVSPSPANTWTHVALSFDGTRSTLFLNGVPVAEGPGIEPDGIGEYLRGNYAGSTEWFSADMTGVHPTAVGREIAEITFFSRMLSADAVLDEGLKVHTGKEAGITCYCSFRPQNDLQSEFQASESDLRFFTERVGGTECLAINTCLVLPGAPAEDSCVIHSDEAPTIYYQNDPDFPGYNPNEEHAFIRAGSGGYVAWALRLDLNTSDTPPPGVFATYTVDGMPRLQFFHVVLTNETWPELADTCEAGLPLPGPHPLDLFDDPWLEEDYWDIGTGAVGPGYRDRKGQLWARAAGTLPFHKYYRMQEGFWFPQYEAGLQPAVGTPIPWLSMLDNPTGSELDPNKLIPATWTWRIQWPETVPTMKIGQTLTVAEKGLPEVWGAKSMAVVYPDPEEAEETVLLTDPTVVQSVDFDYRDLALLGLSVDKDGGLSYRGGKYFFTKLPPAISSRVYVDTTSGKFCVTGQREASASGVSLLYPNVLSRSEREALQQIVDPAVQTSQSAAYGRWLGLCRAIAQNPILPNTPVRDGTEISMVYRPVDHYALTAMGGTNYVVLVENDAEKFLAVSGGETNLLDGAAEGDPVTMRVLRVEPEYYTGRVLTREDAENLLSQQLSVLYAEAFAGKPDDFVFDWRSASPNPNGTIPDQYDETAIYKPRHDVSEGSTAGVGLTRFVIGGQGDTLANMVNKYWICRYRAASTNSPAFKAMGYSWSDWCAPPALAEGWVQRVLNNITPFTQRMQDLYDNPAETTTSMIQQAGPPFQGDVALNQDNLTSIGLIQLYETILNKAESMSLLLGLDDEGANKQLLLAVERLCDLYTLLGDEAYSDAKNPTIGIGSNPARDDNEPYIDFAGVSSGLFCFDNQVRTLLDEELALLRGRTGESAPVTTLPPFYNRLVWNFTRGITAGEVAYAVNYNIEGRETVTLGEEQAATLYPQGHGDAYGHYLSALKGWYRLLRNPHFTWGEPAQGELVVADAAVNADYFEEAKFAQAAVNLAKTAADCVDLTARQTWRDNGGAAGVGYLDEDENRGFGYGEWANRGAYGALCNWVVANSLLPQDATTLPPERAEVLYKDGALTRIDRGTVDELGELCGYASAIQSAEDHLDAGMNPLGLSDNAIPFDITPIGSGDCNETHFEQIRDRAATALKNARTILDRAQEQSNRLRMLQESADSYEQSIEEEEEGYNADLIAIYGTPYSDDCGPSGTYAQGYAGPDLLHYMWMDLAKFGLTDVEDTIEQNTIRYNDLGTYHSKWYWVFSSLGGVIQDNLEKLKAENRILYARSASGLVVKPSRITGTRFTQGTIQEKYGEFLLQYVAAKHAQFAYNNAVSELEYETGFATLMSGFNFAIAGVKQIAEIAKQATEYSDRGIQLALNTLDYFDAMAEFVNDKAEKVVPETLGAGVTVVTSPRSITQAGLTIATGSQKITRASNRYLLKNLQVGYGFADLAAGHLADEIQIWVDYYHSMKDTVAAVKSAASDVNSAAHELQLELARLNVCVEAYNAEVAKGEAILRKREAARKRQVDRIAQMRYNDMLFRQIRNQTLARYSASFDLAQKYVFLAAQAYDYETALLSSDPAAGEAFKARILGSRSLGAFTADGEPVVGDVGDQGLSGLLAQMDANWLVLKPRLGINNPQPYATWFSLRSECFRILPGEEGDAAWARELTKYWTDDIQRDPYFIRYCQPFRSQFGLQEKEPGLIIPFETTIDFAKNFFGNDLAGGDSAYDSTWYATRIAAAGLWFDGYNGRENGYAGKPQLASTPVAYLVPVGDDRMRVPGLDDGTILGFSVVDQTIPAPYAIGSTHLDDAAWIPSMADGDLAGADANARIRRHPSFRAYFNGDGGDPTDDALDCTRLFGRSAWNTKWLLVIPGGGMNADRDKALSVFINGSDENRDGTRDLAPVSDIRIGFKTYSQSGN